MSTKTILLATAALLLAGCDVKDPIYNTPHPDHGKLILTTDWSGCGTGIDVPASYTANVGDHSETLSGACNTLSRLFEPGIYRACIHNTAEHIAVSGTTLTVAGAPGIVLGAGSFVHNSPGWLFTHATQAELAKDQVKELTAPMAQQVRELTLLVEPTGSAQPIARIEAYLSGAAGTLDLTSGAHATASNVVLPFTPITEGPDAGKWTATVRLLGVTGAEQKFYGRILFEGGTPEPVALESDLSADLANFNADKKTPLTLDGSPIQMPMPTEAGFTATIDGWNVIPGTGTAQ